MRGLRRSEAGVRLIERRSAPPGPGEVAVSIAAAGICRTDLHVAGGAIAVDRPVVLGHEASGWIDGRLVAIDPRVGGGFLGIDRDGVFATEVVVPRSAVVPMPRRMDPRRAAYLEPVAASLAVVDAPIAAGDRIAVFGDNRIAELTARVLRACGHRAVDLPARDGGGYDAAIETGLAATDGSLDPIIDAVRPGGLVVLKSRPVRRASLDLRRAVAREVTLRAVSYARFDAAADLLAGDRLELDDLFGDSYALDDWERAFAAAADDERRKQFFAVGAPR